MSSVRNRAPPEGNGFFTKNFIGGAWPVNIRDWSNTDDRIF
jgi:hypothetical protein